MTVRNDANPSADTYEFLPMTQEVRDTFAAEIAALGGVVRDAYDDGARLFLRAVLPPTAEVRPGDAVQGGVALRCTGDELLVHPYTFRQVCTNGAIRAHALEARRVTRVQATAGHLVHAARFDVAVALGALREAVQACAAPAAFDQGVAEMRSASEAEADLVLMLMPWLATLRGEGAGRLATQILRRFEMRPDPDRSAFGLMNAVTSVGRDTRDPETRWRLEVFGGTLPARLPRSEPGQPRRVPLAGALVGV